MMKNFNYKRRNLASGPHIIGLLLTLAGLFALLSPTFLNVGVSSERILVVGIGTMVLGLLIVSSFSGVCIDYAKKRFQEYTSVLGYKFGEWEDLPDISEVKAISVSYMSSNTPNGISPTLSGRVTDYKILIYSTYAQTVLSFEYTKKKQAEENARELATSLNAKLVLNLPENG